MSTKSWVRACFVVAFAMLLAISHSSHGALMLNYQFESVDGAAPSGQTTPDSSGNFTSTAGTVNAVLGHGTNTPGTDFPNLVAGPVQNLTAGVMSRNPNSAMNFPGNPATGNIAGNIERVEIADASAAALDASFSNFTVALWLNPSSTDRDRFAIGKMGGSGQRGWQMSSTGGGTNLAIDYFETAGGADRTLTVANALPLNTWTHVIFTFDGVNQVDKIYINNAEATPTVTGALTSPSTMLNALNSAAFRVGHRGATGNAVGAWAGGIDDVMILNETVAFSAIGSATGTGSLLAPEPGSVVLAVCGLTLAMGARQRRRN